MKNILKEIQTISEQLHETQLTYSFGSEQYRNALKQEIELNLIKTKFLEAYEDYLNYKIDNEIN